MKTQRLEAVGMIPLDFSVTSKTFDVAYPENAQSAESGTSSRRIHAVNMRMRYASLRHPELRIGGIRPSGSTLPVQYMCLNRCTYTEKCHKMEHKY